MDDIGPPPASCPHCGHADPNEFLPMGGAYFCGACGKKLTTSAFDTKRTINTPSPLLPPSTSSPSVAQAQTSIPVGVKEEGGEERKEKGDVLITPVKEQEGKGGVTGLFSRFTIGKKKNEENKENNAPPPSSSPPPLSSPANQTPIKPAIAVSTQPSSSPSLFPLSPSSSSPLPSPLSASSPPPPAVFTVSTPSRPATHSRASSGTPLASQPSRNPPPASSSSSDLSSLTAQLRRELQLQFDKEQEILNMERDDLEAKVNTLTSEREQLQQMVEQLMNEYQVLLDDSQVKRNDYIANMGILEAEMQALRDRTEREQTQYRESAAALDEAQRALHEQSLTIEDARQQLAASQAELEEVKAQHVKLRETATAKLKAASGEYMAIRQREQEKDILLHEIRRELQSAMDKNVVVGGRCKEAEERSERLAGEVQALEEELRETRNELVGMSRELGEVKRGAEEWRARAEENGAIAQRYKEQVLEQREKMRGMEKELRGGGRGGGDEGLRTELAMLRAELEKKESENRELMGMVESLIAQAEAGSQQHQEGLDETY